MDINTLQKDLFTKSVPDYFPEDLVSFRDDNKKSFLETGYPTKFNERWRKFNIKSIEELPFTPVSIDIKLLDESDSAVISKNKIKVINGKVEEETDRKDNGIKSLIKNSKEFPVGKIGSVENGKGTPFYNLNSALFIDALSISIEEKNEVAPIEISYKTIISDKESVVSNRTIIEVGKGVELNLIQHFNSNDSIAILNNSVTEIILNDDATLKHTIFADENINSTHIHQIFVRQNSRSIYEAIPLSSGADFSRIEFQVFMEGENATSNIRGLYIGKDERIFNSDVTIHHRAKNCKSNTLFKGIGSDRSLGVFRGLVHVTKDGAGTDAHQKFNSLALSENAKICTEPHLLIYNDDVACSHGATVGQLDEKQLFYIESRGFDPKEAKKILIKSFAAEVFTDLNKDLKEFFLEKIMKDLDRVLENDG